MAKLKTLETIRAQIERLQQEELEFIARERAAVLERVRDAIKTYGLTMAEITGKRGKRPVKQAIAKAKARKGTSTKQKAKRERTLPRVYVRGATYEIDGKQWVANGQVPDWVRKAMRGAHTLDKWLLELPPNNLKVA